MKPEISHYANSPRGFQRGEGKARVAIERLRAGEIRPADFPLYVLRHIESDSVAMGFMSAIAQALASEITAHGEE